ncbi:MAG: Rossmann-like and DUF2520 domain-containing protein [Bacillota bacterium]
MGRVSVVGAGVLGSAVAVQLKKKGYEIAAVASRREEPAKTLAGRTGAVYCDDAAAAAAKGEIVFLTVPDRAIADTAAGIARAGGFRPGQLVVHMSGALPAEILAPAGEAGAVIMSVHPLQSFASIDMAIKNLPGSFFAIQGDPAGIDKARQIVADLDGRSFVLPPEGKPMYHLGASAASNYLVALIHFAVSLYRQIGMDEETAVEAILPLVKGTLANIESLGPAKALTGPVARGDITTLKTHLQALRQQPVTSRQLYGALGAYTAGVAREKGTIDGSTAEAIIRLLAPGEKGGTANADR